MDIQTYIMPLQIFDGILRNNPRRMDVGTVQDNLYDKIDAGEAVLKHSRHKDIIHQRKRLYRLPVQRSDSALCIAFHRNPSFSLF